jgi:3-hydroxybutyryl-CoA dehydrogenase
MNIKTVGVVGAGQMGNGIAQVAASIQLKVVLFDISQASLDKGLQTIASSCDRLIKKELMKDEDKKKLLSNIQPTLKLEDMKSCDLVVEAATENLDLKLKIFKDLDQITSPECILCSNTSSISITKIASVTKKPHKVAGMHFMNPVPLMKLVEGIQGLQTSEYLLHIFEEQTRILYSYLLELGVESH